MMALAGVEPETLVFEPDALTTRPPPCAHISDLHSAQSNTNILSQLAAIQLSG